MYKVAYNSTSGPVVIDDAGRVIGGGEWGVVDSTSDATKQAIDAGRLVWADEPPADGGNPAAIDAFEHGAFLTSRADALSAHDREQLAGFARSDGLLGEDAPTPLKAQLVDLLARSSFDVATLPSKRTRTTPTTSTAGDEPTKTGS